MVQAKQAAWTSGSDMTAHLGGPEVPRVDKNTILPCSPAHTNFGNTRTPPLKDDANASKRQLAKLSHTVSKTTTVNTGEHVSVQTNSAQNLWHSPVAITKSSGVSR